jgi:type II secretion system protein D
VEEPEEPLPEPEEALQEPPDGSPPEGGIGAPPAGLGEGKTAILSTNPGWKGERVDIAPGQIGVLEFLRFLADYTGLPVIVDSTNPQLQTQTILIAAPMDGITGDIVIALLKANKFLVTREKLPSGDEVLNVQSQQGAAVAAGSREPKANPLIEVRDRTAKRIDSDTSFEIQDIRPDEIATMVFTLKYTQPDDAIQSLNSLIGGAKGAGARSPAFSIADVKNSMLVIVTAKFGLLDYLAKLLSIIDVPIREPERIIQIINIENADAVELSQLIEEFLQGRGGGFGGGRGGRGGRRGRGGARKPAAGQKAQAGAQGFDEPETTLIPDWRTQKIIVETYSERDLEDIQMLVRELDMRYDIRRLKTHIYQVRYLKAEEVAANLQELVGGAAGGRSGQGSLGGRRRSSSRRQGVGRGGRGGRGAGGATASAPGAAGGGQNTPMPALIVPHIQTNSLIIQAEPEDYAEILHILAKIDTKRRQVFLEAALVQVQATSNLTYTIELLAGQPSNESTRLLFESSFGLTGLDFENFNRIINPDSPIPPGALFAIMNRGKFPAIVHFLKNNTDSQVLATPFILADDNQPNVIDILETRFVQNTASTAAGQTSSQEGEDAGITLQITPTISSEDAVFLEMEFEVSAFDDTSAAGNPNILPPKTTNTISSAVTIPDGEIFVIGGLTRESRAKAVSKVPILGDIPILGKLFRSEVSGKSANNLYIFLRAHVLTHEEFADGAALTAQAQGFVQEFAPGLKEVRFDSPDVEKTPPKPRDPDDPQRFYRTRSKYQEGHEAPHGPFSPATGVRTRPHDYGLDPDRPSDPGGAPAPGSPPIPRTFINTGPPGGLDKPPSTTSGALEGTGMEVDPGGESWLVPLRRKR